MAMVIVKSFRSSVLFSKVFLFRVAYRNISRSPYRYPAWKRKTLVQRINPLRTASVVRDQGARTIRILPTQAHWFGDRQKQKPLVKKEKSTAIWRNVFCFASCCTCLRVKRKKLPLLIDVNTNGLWPPSRSRCKKKHERTRPGHRCHCVSRECIDDKPVFDVQGLVDTSS